MLTKLQEGIIYGPVRSRRLGNSLGINLMPDKKKVCTFNCLYCQYGWGDTEAARAMKNEELFPLVSEVLDAVEKALTELMPEFPDFITFAGNGEPTLHPRFGEIVDGVVEIRNRLTDSAKVAVLSNSSNVTKEHIRAALSLADEKIMKLDAGNEAMFNLYNKPASGITLADIINGIKKLKNVTIQSLFTGGPMGNYRDDHIADWTACIKDISPQFVQIYSLDREAPCRDILPLTRYELYKIKQKLDQLGINSRVF